MTEAELDAYINATSRALDLTIEEEWRDSVRANLAVSMKFCLFVDEFDLGDEAEPACVFSA